MSNRSNLTLHIGATLVNRELSHMTVINPYITNPDALAPGTLLAGKYEIDSPISLSDGEADVYLCRYNGKEYAAKIYRKGHSIKPEISAALKKISSPYIASPIEGGIYGGSQYEILPYYKNGSISGKRFSVDELKSNIIPCLNEALDTLHGVGIIHKDVKPANIMLCDDGKTVALIDYGISSIAGTGGSVVTRTGMTPEYSAPETFRSLFMDASDYYSLGITLYELFCGHTPYRNTSAADIARISASQSIPLPRDMPKELKDLVRGLTYFDVTNQGNANEPLRRWTHAEVSNWLRGISQIVPGEKLGFGTDGSMPDREFSGKTYKNVYDFVKALAKNWDEGKKELYSGELTKFFRTFDHDITQMCEQAEEKAKLRNADADTVYRELLYRMHPELKGFYWKGRAFEGLPELGRNLLEDLWQSNSSSYPYWDGVFKNGLLSDHLAISNSQDASLVALAADAEASHAAKGATERDRIMNYYKTAYLLSGQKLMAVGNKRLGSIEELTAHMKGLLDISYAKLQEFCHSMIDYGDTLDAQLEAWLIALGKTQELQQWRDQISK